MLEHLIIKGASRLEGRVRVSGAKNSALPLFISCLLSSTECYLENVPDLEDIAVTSRLLKSLGAQIDFADNKLRVNVPQILSTEAPYALVKALRASFWVLGPLLARSGKAQVALPGGDAIGSRPVDLHLKGLTQMNADIRLEHGVVFASAPGRLRGAKIKLDFPSVGATHHLLMTAALVPGETVIEGAAREPEIVELGNFIQRMGAMVEGTGSSTIRVLGRRELGGARIGIMGDRIEAATYLIAGAVTQGKVSVLGIPADTFRSSLEVLAEMGCTIEEDDKGITASAQTRLKNVSCKTAPYPGLATDIQPMLMAAMSIANGRSEIEETVFENRFGHVAEFRRLGAKIEINGRQAVINGVPKLSGAPVQAGDIRAAAALVLMGLIAEGVTQLHEVHHLDRGYENLIEKCQSLGAHIYREPVFEGKELVYGC